MYKNTIACQFLTRYYHYQRSPCQDIFNIKGLTLCRAFSSNFGKGPWQKLGEINDIEYNKDSKLYPQNQVIIDCFMSSIPFKHKCLSIILIWVIVSHK